MPLSPSKPPLAPLSEPGSSEDAAGGGFPGPANGGGEKPAEPVGHDGPRGDVQENFLWVWEGTADGLRITDETGVIVRVNQAYCRILGQPRERLEGQLFTSGYHRNAQEMLMADHRRSLTGEPAPLTARRDLTLLDGRRVCLDASYSQTQGPGGRMVFTILRDITNQKSDEEMLRRNEEKYRSMVEAAPDWIWEIDREGRHSYSNPSVRAILGYPPEEIVGHYAAALLDRDDARERQETLVRLAAERRGWKGWVSRWRHKDGTWRYLESYAEPILDDGGEVVGYRGVDRDITEQRLRMQRCDQSQKLESIGRLAGGIAHDFNNLLTVILGYADQTLAILFPGDPLHASVSAIQKAGQQAAALTRQLLAFGSRQAMQPRPLDLNAVIADTERMLRRVIGEDIDLSTALCNDLKMVLADPGQIAQILMNLAVNARDAMPKGGEIHIETAHAEVTGGTVPASCGILPGSYVLLTVSDTGVGMDEHVQARLFEPFFTTKQADKGTGLGLSTVYGIVKQAGGYIQVSSQVMRGTTFKIYLPVLQGAASSTEPQSPAADPRGTETILLVEDQEEVRKFVADALGPLGYTVLGASGPQDGLRLLRHYEQPIDLVLTDVVLPGMPGTQLAGMVEGLRPGTKILYMSGYPEDLALNQEILKQGVCYLSKPFTRQELAAKVREAIGHRSRRTVLIIDDEAQVRTFLREVLRRGGYEVLEAADGRLAMEVLDREHVDLVITDLAMPEREGIETIQYARRAYASIKIVAISGKFGGDVLNMSRFLGADAALAKPVSADVVLQTTRQLLGEL